MDLKDYWGWFGHSFNRIYCEFIIENMFYRKDSKFKSYHLEQQDNKAVEIFINHNSKFIS